MKPIKLPAVDEIQTFVHSLRNSIEPHWSSSLLYEKFVSMPGDAISAGFCGPSSVVLWQELTAAFPDEHFSIAVGRVYKNQSEWIRGKHVWVVLHHALKGATIVDITADQSNDTDTKILVEDIDSLAARGINYLPYQLARSLDEVDESPKQRAAKLRERLTSALQ